MSIRKAVYDLLNDSEADVYPFVAPQELKVPYVVYNVRLDPVRIQGGIGPYNVEVSLSIFANALSDSITLADAMFAGTEAATGSYDTETLMIANWVSEDGFYLDDLKKYVITQEYQLYFE